MSDSKMNFIIFTGNKFWLMVQEVNESNFDEIVLKSDKPVLVDLWAEWCGPCKLIHPIMEEMATEFDGKAIIASVDVEANPKITTKFRIRNIPTVLFFKNGKIVDKQVGAVSKSKFISKLEPLL